MVGSSRMWNNTWEQSDLVGSIDEDTLMMTRMIITVIILE